MRRILCPYATAGVVLIGAGLIGVTPVAAPLPDVQVRNVALASDTDSLGPWQEVFNTASQNATTLLNNYFSAPSVALQQVVANQAGFAQQLLDDPTSISNVMVQLQDNLAAAWTGYGLQGASDDTRDTVLAHTLECSGCLASGHAVLFGEIPGYIPADEQAAALPIINFLASPASGIIMGELGPLISPWVALFNSLGDGDNANQVLANMVGAFFNGATLNLDSLIPTINGAGLFPPGMSMVNLDIGFGGLLSPGSVGLPAGGDSVGGSIFNSVGIDFTGVPSVGNLDAPSEPVGPIGALEGWAQAIADLLGWSGSGSPLADVTLPVIPDDGGAAASLAADVPTWWQDLVAAL
ncbi:outer membrane porin GjpA [Mycolicibacter kumamotonensis]|uniref:PE-PGRS family protein n=1 Tax=Mycolicibacter kumamotonensis TaxID=354243 RepID=A0A1B8SE11_9MYCO|nr:outer membrane porin GjpA [Mycolicibacter kumamotonensis]OBY30934.1 hypothetical protein ACT18_15170 [Mycolicibacter kumamotonensis]